VSTGRGLGDEHAPAMHLTGPNGSPVSVPRRLRLAVSSSTSRPNRSIRRKDFSLARQFARGGAVDPISSGTPPNDSSGGAPAFPSQRKANDEIDFEFGGAPRAVDYLLAVSSGLASTAPRPNPRHRDHSTTLHLPDGVRPVNLRQAHGRST